MRWPDEPVLILQLSVEAAQPPTVKLRKHIIRHVHAGPILHKPEGFVLVPPLVAAKSGEKLCEEVDAIRTRDPPPLGQNLFDQKGSPGTEIPPPHAPKRGPRLPRNAPRVGTVLQHRLAIAFCERLRPEKGIRRQTAGKSDQFPTRALF